MAKAILIDPKKKTVVEVQQEGGLEALYQTLGCDTIERLGVRDGSLYFDEEARLTRAEDDPSRWSRADAFLITLDRGVFHIIGRALVLGMGEEGEDTDSPFTAEEIRQIVTFPGEDPARVFLEALARAFLESVETIESLLLNADSPIEREAARKVVAKAVGIVHRAQREGLLGPVPGVR